MPLFRKNEIVFETQDEHGSIQVKEKNNIRSLHFDHTSKQSGLFIDQPDLLALEYVRNLSSIILFHDHFESVLFLGLGGGSLPRFFNQHFAHTIIDIVELRPVVYQVAKDYFLFPDHLNISLFFQDALVYLAGCKKNYDLIIVDIFNADGLSKSALHLQFMKKIKSRLNPQGLFGINLWSNALNQHVLLNMELSSDYHKNILKIAGQNFSNQIQIGKAKGPLETNFPLLQERSSKLSNSTEIDYITILDKIYEQNLVFQ